jgi:site-specific DNA recombinase
MESKSIEAVAYLRVSGKGQVEGTGLDRQRDMCETYAKANGFSIVDTFTDEGVSGCLEPAHRPGLRALIGRLLLNSVRVLLVEHPDRLGRDSEVGPAVRLALRKVPGLRVIRVDRGVDVLDEGQRDQNTIDDLISDRARRLIVERTRRGRDRVRAATGRCEGRKPYGYFEHESRGLTRLIELVQGQRVSLRKAAETLTREGVPTRGGNPWTPYSVSLIAKRSASAVRGRAA